MPIADRVAALSDEQAVTTLALVLERQGLAVDPFTQAEQEAHLREALTQPEITDSVDPTPEATRGDLAHTALTYLAETGDTTRGLIDHAMGIAPRADRDPNAAVGHRRAGAARVPRRHRARPRTGKGLDVPVPHQGALGFHDREGSSASSSGTSSTPAHSGRTDLAKAVWWACNGGWRIATVGGELATSA